MQDYVHSFPLTPWQPQNLLNEEFLNLSFSELIIFHCSSAFNVRRKHSLQSLQMSHKLSLAIIGFPSVQWWWGHETTSIQTTKRGQSGDHQITIRSFCLLPSQHVACVDKLNLIELTRIWDGKGGGQAHKKNAWKNIRPEITCNRLNAW